MTSKLFTNDHAELWVDRFNTAFFILKDNDFSALLFEGILDEKRILLEPETIEV